MNFFRIDFLEERTTGEKLLTKRIVLLAIMSNNVKQVKITKKYKKRNTGPPKPEKFAYSGKRCSHPECSNRILLCRYEAGETTCHIHDEMLVTFRKLYCQKALAKCNHCRCINFPEYLDENTNFRYCLTHKPKDCKLSIRFPFPTQVKTCSEMNCLSEGTECSNLDERTGLLYCSLHSPKTCLHLEFYEFKKCGSIMCDKIFPKDLNSKFCKLHRPNTQLPFIMANGCFLCNRFAEYGTRIGGNATYCIDHKVEGMVRVDGSTSVIDGFQTSSIIIQDNQSVSSGIPLGNKEENVVCLSSSNISINEGERASKFQKLEEADEDWEAMYFTNIFDSDFNECLIAARYQ